MTNELASQGLGLGEFYEEAELPRLGSQRGRWEPAKNRRPE